MAVTAFLACSKVLAMSLLVVCSPCAYSVSRSLRWFLVFCPVCRCCVVASGFEMYGHCPFFVVSFILL